MKQPILKYRTLSHTFKTRQKLSMNEKGKEKITVRREIGSKGDREKFK